ncbi:unnamed protein product [Rhizophagus irregularis]|nr:unnamed protein product [Rhizophagus irregularis]
MEDKGLFESKENSSEEEENEIVILGLTSLLRTRYLEQRNFYVAKSKYWYYNILPKYDLYYKFKIIMRMDSLNFQKLVLRFGIAKGTVYLYCKRVMIAILSLKKTLVKWPTGEDKQYDEGFKNIGGMENVIGTIDGSHIGLAP